MSLYFLSWPLAYLVGGINFGIIVSRLFFRKDVRETGSGNAGATNMLRSFGKLSAVLVFIGDVVKGAAVVFFARWMTGYDEELLYVVLTAGFLVIVGHVFPVYFRFKGGKGVATTLGVILAIEPIAAVILFALFIIIALTTKYISLGSIISASLIPVAIFVIAYFSNDLYLQETVFGLAVAALVVFMHRKNISRLIKGQESKVSLGKRKK